MNVAVVLVVVLLAKFGSANDYTISELDPRCAAATTEAACLALGNGCVFSGNVCQFDRSLKCSSAWGTVYKNALLKSLSCGATASDHCPSPTCTEAAAQMYASIRMKYGMSSFLSYNSLYVEIAFWPKANQTALQDDLALCSSEVTTAADLKATLFSPDACLISDDVAKNAYAAAISGSLSTSTSSDGTTGNTAKSDAVALSLWTIFATICVAGAVHYIL